MPETGMKPESKRPNSQTPQETLGTNRTYKKAIAPTRICKARRNKTGTTTRKNRPHSQDRRLANIPCCSPARSYCTCNTLFFLTAFRHTTQRSPQATPEQLEVRLAYCTPHRLQTRTHFSLLPGTVATPTVDLTCHRF
ncbi:unnamed protein product [Ectocarpus sp. 6 AP-2014]